MVLSPTVPVTGCGESLEQRIETRQAVLCVVGLGYVGLPLAVALAEAGFPVRGLDVAPEKVARLRDGRSPVMDIEDETVERLTRGGRFRAEFDAEAALGGADAAILTVPTPCTESRVPDMRYVRHAAETVAGRLRRGMLVVLESTIYPGATEEFVRPILERSGLRCGPDFLLAFSPERIEPGNRRFGLKNTPKLVAGTTLEATAAAAALYATVADRIVPASSPRIAEMAKLLENTFRLVNIGLVNEIAQHCDALGIDVWEVIDCAATKPFGFMPFQPGPGVGGHCIPVDPHYLAWALREKGRSARFVDLAAEVNAGMPEYVVRRVQDALNESRKSLNGSRVLVLGIAYKRDIDDVRESPALPVLEGLLRKGAQVRYHDPYVRAVETSAGPLLSQPFGPAVLRDADAAVILTDHTCIPYGEVLRHSELVIDTRNAMRAYKDPRIVRL